MGVGRPLRRGPGRPALRPRRLELRLRHPEAARGGGSDRRVGAGADAGEAGERRSLLVAFPILPPSVADRRTASNEWAADLGEELRARARIKSRARQRAETAKARGVDVQLARGSCLTRPYAVCTVTVPKTVRAAEYGRRLDAAVRRAGFAPLRLDLAHDVAFAASTVPVGVSLTRPSSR